MNNKLFRRNNFLAIIILLFFSNNLFSQQHISLNKWEWSDKPFWQSPAANMGHFVGSSVIAYNLEKQGMKWWEADLLTFTMGLSWEIKDGLVKDDYYGGIGGEGFSYKDLIADVSGILVNRAITYAINKIVYKKRYQKVGINIFAQH